MPTIWKTAKILSFKPIDTEGNSFRQTSSPVLYNLSSWFLYHRSLLMQSSVGLKDL